MASSLNSLTMRVTQLLGGRAGAAEGGAVLAQRGRSMAWAGAWYLAS